MPPTLAPWLTERFEVEAYSVAYLGYRDAEDEVIFQAAQQAEVVVVSKDADFLERIVRLGTPPSLLYVTCGNTSKAQLKVIFESHFQTANDLFLKGESVVEIS